ncbi:rod-binding protein [Celeribacter indicus]|uniref:Flagellar protein FlgJ n=1 Tax=Celeribacter indicus TaxID=1208324 RepID=A0A0B5DVL3_9RHOB|nr:rod-binding protein [Celeribacter indicus]AJE44801.1 flagellar protein FlgJ [Celeribacter indicus]SDX24689.1 Rod binding protein [Celeribacter indicus]
MHVSPKPPPETAGPPGTEERLRTVSRQLEATFLAEMLKSAGFGQTREAFGGGAGEDQFSSFLVHAQAEKMVEAGGLGLAEQIFNALRETIHDDP